MEFRGLGLGYFHKQMGTEEKTCSEEKRGGGGGGIFCWGTHKKLVVVILKPPKRGTLKKDTPTCLFELGSVLFSVGF